VIRGLEALPEDVPVVLDPVLAASDGTPLLERRAWGRIGELSRRAALVLPNRIEAEQLTGEETARDAGCERAATALLEAGARAVLVKGGHRQGAPRDLLARRDAATGEVVLDWLEGERLEGGPVHGTGCALASAVAARLAQGDALADAVARARAFVREAIHRAHAVGGGARFLDCSAR
jgi:hydroxymethylpyrimidine/phosphomethylpyrimidine kinase